MKRIVLTALAALVTSCGGGGGSSNAPFKTGLYYGQVESTTDSGLCQYVSQFVNYSVGITEAPTEEDSSRVQIQKTFITSHGVFPGEVSVFTSAGSGEVSFADFRNDPENPTHSFGQDENGTQFDISCVTEDSTVHLSADEVNVQFSADSRLACTDVTTGENFNCDITEVGELAPSVS